MEDLKGSRFYEVGKASVGSKFQILDVLDIYRVQTTVYDGPVVESHRAHHS